MYVEIFQDDDLNKKFNHMRNSTLDIEQTINLIIEKGLSIARFGDGEIRMLNSLRGCAFEGPSAYGTSKLRAVMAENHEKLLVCIPGKMRDAWWSKFWNDEFSEFSKYLKPTVYGDAFVSRAIFRVHGEKGAQKWKNVWGGRKVVFITGVGSRFDCNHELFDNIPNHEVIYSSATHAIKDVPRLIFEASCHEKDTLFLLSLGPAATILAMELTLLGYQALDIGHITASYERVFNGGLVPEKMALKNN